MRGKPIPIPVVAAPPDAATAAADPFFSQCAGAEPFALIVLGDSMEPEFREGDIIIVEPDGLLRDGVFVIAWAAGEWYFRQLRSRVDGAGWTLHPLNPVYSDIALDSLDRVRGVVIQKRHAGRRHVVTRYLPDADSVAKNEV